MLFSTLPDGAVEVSVGILLHDARDEPVGRGTIGDVGTGQAAALRFPEWMIATIRSR